MNNPPTFVAATTCKGRLQHIKQTLPKNLKDAAHCDNFKFVVLDYGDKDGLLDYLRSEHMADIESGKLTVYSYPCEGPFHVAHAKNIAARCAIREGADILVTVDADNFINPLFTDFLNNAFQYKSKIPGFYICPDFTLIHSLPHGPLRPLRGYAGRLAIRAMDFIKMGGYDETFDTWHGEDMDLIARMIKIGYAERHFDNRFLGVIPHGTEVRFREYPHAVQYENKKEIENINARKETLVNYGKFGLGRVYRNFSDMPVELETIPTRVFGIGMHKTATSSLHAAFQILGFDSFHWGAGEAPKIWHEMETNGVSPTLEAWYALSDLPIPLLYQKLDKAYPGSKFVLTVRDEKMWLKSVERLWSYRYNSTRRLWDIYPFSNKIHSVLYGQTRFDPVVFLERYRRHNREVQEHFRDRPNDLLTVSMDGGGDWDALCQFLGVPVPTVPYPAHNITPEIDIDSGFDY